MLGTSEPVSVEEHKVLGIPWSPEADRFHFNVTHLAENLTLTNRNFVSLVGRFYDPLGFLSPVIINQVQNALSEALSVQV